MPEPGWDGPGRPRTAAPRPDEIATRRFSRTLFGVHPGEVRRAIVEAAAAMDRSRAAHARELLEYRALEKSLQAASRRIQDLEQQLSAAAAGPGTQPEEIVAAAHRTANAIVSSARTYALEVLRSARATAQAIRQSADAIPSAGRDPVDGDVEDVPETKLRVSARRARR